MKVLKKRGVIGRAREHSGQATSDDDPRTTPISNISETLICTTLYSTTTNMGSSTKKKKEKAQDFKVLFLEYWYTSSTDPLRRKLSSRSAKPSLKQPTSPIPASKQNQSPSRNSPSPIPLLHPLRSSHITYLSCATDQTHNAQNP